MSGIVNGVVLYFLTIGIIQHNEKRNVPALILDIAQALADNLTGIRFLYKFIIIGEATVITVVDVSNLREFNRVVEKLWRFGDVQVDCVPVINSTNFARNLGVPEELLTIDMRNILRKDALFWEVVDVGQQGLTTDELLALWREQAQAVFTAIKKGELRLNFYKVLAARKVHVFLNIPDTVEYDFRFSRFPFVRKSGSNVHVTIKGIQFLDDYVSSMSYGDFC